MIIVANNLHGDYQLANGYGYSKAKEVLKVISVSSNYMYASGVTR